MKSPLTILGCATTLAFAASVAALPAKPLEVTSTLDGKTLLPRATHWIATPHVAPAKVREVDFLIDGKLRGIELRPPYTYGGDDLHGHLGYLFTSWLAPGKHTFTARVKLTSGETGDDTVIARVPPAVAPPAALAGTWTRTVTDGDVKKATSGEAPPAGRWKLVLDRVGAWVLDPKGSGVVEAYVATPSTIRAIAPIQMAPFRDGKGGISRFGHHAIGGTVCREDGPPGTWAWSVAGNELTLTPVHDPCGDRKAIWEGTWSRVG